MGEKPRMAPERWVNSEMYDTLSSQADDQRSDHIDDGKGRVLRGRESVHMKSMKEFATQKGSRRTPSMPASVTTFYSPEGEEIEGEFQGKT